MKRYYSLLTIFNNENTLIAYSICGDCEYEYEIIDNNGYYIKNYVFDTYKSFFDFAICCKYSVGATELINL